MMHLSQTAHDKLDRYHREAETYRKLPKTAWRSRAAAGLRALADSLELEAPPKVGGRTFGGAGLMAEKVLRR